MNEFVDKIFAHDGSSMRLLSLAVAGRAVDIAKL
jgi:hypothetical protein